MKQFIKDMLSGNSDVSSKRVMGVTGYLACIVVICVWKQDMLSQLLYTSAALIGLGILDKIKAA